MNFFVKSKILSSESIASTHKIKGVATISLLTSLFLYNLIPKDIWATYISSNLPDEIQTVGVSIVLSTILLMVFYHSDPLFKGNGKTSIWIRSLFASNLLVERFDVNKHKANSLWFKYFNQWQHKEHPNHSFLKKVHAASYRARLIYFTIFLCFVFATVGSIFYLYSFLGDVTSSYLILSLFYLVLGLILRVLNTPPKFSNGLEKSPAKGVWYSVESSFMEAKNRFDAEIVAKCDSIIEAEKLVETSGEKWLK